MITTRQSDFLAATRLSYIPKGADLTDVCDLIANWQDQYGVPPQQMQETLLRDMPDATKLHFGRTGGIHATSEKHDGEMIFYDSRNFGQGHIGAGCISIQPDYQGFGYGAAWVRNLIEAGRKSHFNVFSCSAGSEFGGHAWAGVFEPCAGKQTMEKYVSPVKKRLEIILPHIPESESATVSALQQIIAADCPSRAQMSILAAWSFDLTDVLQEVKAHKTRSDFYQTYTSYDRSNGLQLARTRARKSDGTLHAGRVLTITTRWDGQINLQEEASYGPALEKLNARVERGKPRAKAQGWSI